MLYNLKIKMSNFEQPGSLLETPEQRSIASNFPLGERLEEVYRLELGVFDPPESARLVSAGERPDITVFSTGDEPEHELHDSSMLWESYIKQKAQQATLGSWWQSIATALESDGISHEEANNLHLAAKHNCTISVNDAETNQGYEVFEIGENGTDKDTLATVFNTLRLADQYSGGLLASDSKRPRIVLLNDLRPMTDNGEALGIATREAVELNLSAIKELAAHYNVSQSDLLASVITHELMGHSVDHLVTGDYGNYFERFFDYSAETAKGEFYNSIHAKVTPKSDSVTSSQPVREYGKVNAAEDLATSVEAGVSKSMGWSRSMDKLPKHKAVEDEYRRELVSAIFGEAAVKATEYEGTPGVVGSQMRFEYDETGKPIAVKPVRTMKVRSISGEQAVAEEIQKVVKKYRPPKELKVRVDSDDV